MRSLPALPHPGDRAGAPSVPVSSAASGFQPFSFTARRLSSSRKPTRSFRRCAVRVRRASRTASVSGKPSSACLSLAAHSRTRAASSSCSTRSISSWSRCVLWYAMLHLFYPAGYIGRAAGREVFSLPSRSEQLPLVFTPGLLWGRSLAELQSLTKTDSEITVTHPLVLLKTLTWPLRVFRFPSELSQLFRCP